MEFIIALGTYRSKNKSKPGEGEVIACFQDNIRGQNGLVVDKAAIQVTSGPFEGYKVPDTEVQGKVNKKTCKA